MSTDGEDCPCGHEDVIHLDGRCIEDGCGCERRLAASFIEDCAEAKSTEEVRGLIGRYYEMPGNSAGGSLHIVLDDGNISRSDVEWCLSRANLRGDWAGVVLANLLLRLDEATYAKVLAGDQVQSEATP